MGIFYKKQIFSASALTEKGPECLWHKLTPLVLTYPSPTPWSFKNIYSRCNSFSQQHIPFETSKMAEAGKQGWCKEQDMGPSFALGRQFSTSDVTEGPFHPSSALGCVFLGASAWPAFCSTRCITGAAPFPACSEHDLPVVQQKREGWEDRKREQV